MAHAFGTPPPPKQAWPAATPLTAKRAEHAEGYAYLAGSTRFGELGLPHHSEPIRAPRLQTRLMNDGVVQVSCGWRHTAFVLSGGDAYCCGDGAYGKLGCGGEVALPEPSRVVFSAAVHVMSVSCGQHHTAFVSGDRCVWTCGLGLYGQLGHGGAANEGAASGRRLDRTTRLQQMPSSPRALLTPLAFATGRSRAAVRRGVAGPRGGGGVRRRAHAPPQRRGVRCLPPLPPHHLCPHPHLPALHLVQAASRVRHGRGREARPPSEE